MFTYIEQSEGEGDMILRQDRKVAKLRTWNTLAIFPTGEGRGGEGWGREGRGGISLLLLLVGHLC